MPSNWVWGTFMLEGKGRISRRKDGKDFLYLPKSVVGDSAFPFKLHSSVDVKVLIDPDGERLLILPLDKTRGPRRKGEADQSR